MQEDTRSNFEMLPVCEPQLWRLGVGEIALSLKMPFPLSGLPRRTNGSEAKRRKAVLWVLPEI